MTTFLAAFVILGLAVLGMALGVIFGRSPIKGSCGGLNNVDGLEGDCQLCGNKKCEKKLKQAK